MSPFLSTNSIHLARSMMYGELETVLNYLQSEKISPIIVKKAIIEQNCLAKNTGNNRVSTCDKLISHYILNEEVEFFRSFYFFWHKNEFTKNVLAFLFSFSRDRILYEMVPYVVSFDSGAEITLGQMEGVLSEKYGHKYRESTLRSMVQNLRSTLTQSGHLKGKVKKIKSKPVLDSNGIAYALYLGYTLGIRGELLFESEFMKAIECSVERGINLAFDASAKGILNMKKVGNVIEIQFPRLITQELFK